MQHRGTCIEGSLCDADFKGHRSNTADLPAMVAEDTAFKNARENSDRENARVEAGIAVRPAVLGIHVAGVSFRAGGDGARRL